MRVFPKPSIHTFEPSPSTFSELSRGFAVYENVILNNCGVDSQKSEMDFIENIPSEIEFAFGTRSTALRRSQATPKNSHHDRRQLLGRKSDRTPYTS
jgi:hypothetical protein